MNSENIRRLGGMVLGIMILLCACTVAPVKEESSAPVAVLPVETERAETGYAATDGGQSSESPSEPFVLCFDRVPEEILTETKWQGEPLSEAANALPRQKGEMFLSNYQEIGGTRAYLGGFRFPLTPESAQDTAVFSRKISFSLYGSDQVLKTDAISRTDDYAQVIRSLAQRSYLTAAELTSGTTGFALTLFSCYIENPDGSVDVYTLDEHLFVLHKTGDVGELADASSLYDKSEMPLTEEELFGIFAAAVRCLNTSVPYRITPFRYRGDEAGLLPALEVKMVKDGEESLLAEEEWRALYRQITQAEDAFSGAAPSVWCFDENYDSLKDAVRFLVLNTDANQWSDGVYFDEFYLLQDGTVARECPVLRLASQYGAGGMFVKAPILCRSTFSYPIGEWIGK